MTDITIDALSLIADVAGELTLGFAPAGAPLERTVATWLADGAPGARDPWLDPADHLVAGLDARLRDGTALRIRPGPRRAVGPDLVALFFGARGRFGAIERAHLRVHHVGARRPETHAFVHPRDPELLDGEAELLRAIERELGPA